MTFPRFYEEINHLPHYIKIIFCVLVFLYPLKAQSTSHLREKTTFQELQTVHIYVHSLVICFLSVKIAFYES